MPLTVYQPLDKPTHPLMSVTYPHYVVREEYLGMARISAYRWTGVNPTDYNPRHVPAIIYHVYLPGDWREWGFFDGTIHGSIWEYSRFSCEPYEATFNRRVRVLPPPDDLIEPDWPT